VDYLSNKKKVQKMNGPAQAVTTDTPSQETKISEAPKDPLQEPIQIPKKVINMARKFGVPVDALVDRTNMIQQRIIGIEQAVISMAKAVDQRDQKLAPLVRFAEEVEARRTVATQNVPPQGMPQAGALGLQDIPWREILGGGTQDQEMVTLTKDIMKMQVERMKQDAGFVDAIKSAIVSKIATKAVGDVIG